MIETLVNSSNLAKVGWENETLYVRFKRGDVYSYKGVPLDVYNRLIEAPSVGRFFLSDVMDVYPSEKLGVPPEGFAV